MQKKNNISPHWFWFGIYPFFGWIAFGIVYANKGRKICPKCLEKLKMHAMVCAYCNHPFDDTANHLSTDEVKQQKKKKRHKNIMMGIGIFAGISLFMLLIITYSFTNSWAYENAFKLAKSNQELKEKIGTPIEQSWPFISGSINKTGNSGRADLGIPVKGPRESGTLFAKANRREGIWSMNTLTFRSSENEQTIWISDQFIRHARDPED
ncbi:cytochrome c oxidase assembly factor 1 family protein [Bacteroidia bacterium]|nr:cytochrome c oxidase assembly factor 1 family protein [Bacteroidia bacterium]MDB9882327.1 cytochrome c oxidase assembly factor 1 family protein [Bacteroidia bacterium]